MANDAQLRFADNDSIAANAAADVDPVGDVLDLWNATTNPRIDFWPNEGDGPNDLGDTELVFEVMVTTAMAGNGAVVTILLYNHTAATTLASGNIIYEQTFTVGASGIAAGTYLIKAGVPANRINERYLGVVSSVETQNLTAGSIDASLTTVKEHNPAHGQISPLA